MVLTPTMFLAAAFALALGAMLAGLLVVMAGVVIHDALKHFSSSDKE